MTTRAQLEYLIASSRQTDLQLNYRAYINSTILPVPGRFLGRTNRKQSCKCLEVSGLFVVNVVVFYCTEFRTKPPTQKYAAERLLKITQS